MSAASERISRPDLRNFLPPFGLFFDNLVAPSTSGASRAMLSRKLDDRRRRKRKAIALLEMVLDILMGDTVDKDAEPGLSSF